MRGSCIERRHADPTTRRVGGTQYCQREWQRAPTVSPRTLQATKVRLSLLPLGARLTPADRPIRRRTRSPTATTGLRNGHSHGPGPAHGHARLSGRDAHAGPIRRSASAAADDVGDDTAGLPAAAGVRDAASNGYAADDGGHSAASAWICKCVTDAAEIGHVPLRPCGRGNRPPHVAYVYACTIVVKTKIASFPCVIILI